MSIEVMDQPDSGTFRNVMGRFPTGVTVVATMASEGMPRGLTVNSFTSVSLDPPQILVCIDTNAATYAHLVGTGRFAVSVLASDQAEVAYRFAGDPSESRFDSVPWSTSATGNPIVEGATAWLDCEVGEIMDGGTHSILLARVVRCEASGREPLVFHAGEFGRAET